VSHLPYTIESLFAEGAYVNLLWSVHGLDTYTSSLWIEAVGLAGTVIGFFLMAREFSSKKMVDEAI
jgi:general stress protein CsbA